MSYNYPFYFSKQDLTLKRERGIIIAYRSMP